MKIEKVGNGFVITDFDVVSAYRIACNIEKEGVSFYQKLGAGIKDDKIRKLLEFLVEQEQSHLKFFDTKRVTAISEADGYNEDDDIVDGLDTEIFAPYSKMENLGEQLTDLYKVLKLGVIAESNSVEFYSVCMDRIDDLTTKNEINNIIQEEKRHKAMLEQLLTEL